MECLIEKGHADANTADADGSTVLHFAIEDHNIDAVESSNT